MKTLLIDSCYVIAVVSRNDQHHDKAMTLSKEIQRLKTLGKYRFVITRGVMLDIGLRLSKPHQKPKSIDILNAFSFDDAVEIVEITESLYDKGFATYCSRLDKKWSLPDCISFVVMQERGITEALSTDQDFEQADFIPLLLR